ncbi:patatin-like phospholipase family protein [Rhodoferax sp.]|uniref:patatin-like phospholipase family protein n=1 Tax=Rhodoferax sp. TaxID=50421 RepID=UPI00374D6246
MTDRSATPPTAIPSATSGWAQFTRLLGKTPPTLNLALHGGGAHGAFTWGVLDALLQQPELEFEGLSGSSAGAMNAVVFADGWMKGGRQGAGQALAEFWTEVGRQMPWEPMTRGDEEAVNLSPATKIMAQWAGYFSPAQLNPFALNPLRDMLARQIDFTALRQRSPFKLFVGATQANTGKLRVFRETELTVDMLLASACLPKIHHTVEIDGQPYWDGGYSANPAVFPLFFDCASRDVMLVLLSPLEREGTPRTVQDINTRIAELGFSAHFMREMRMFAQATAFAQRPFIRWGRLERRLHAMRFHMVDSSGLVNLERSDTKLLAHGPFLELLREQGRLRGSDWLAQHTSAIGQHGTLDLQACFS